MKSVYCLNPISNAGMSRFDDTYCIADSIENADAVLLFLQLDVPVPV